MLTTYPLEYYGHVTKIDQMLKDVKPVNVCN